MAAILQIKKLTVELATAAGRVKPVNEVSLELAAGEGLGLVGESGSGKTMLSLALMGLLPPGARVSGEMSLATKTRRTQGEEQRLPGNLLGFSEEEWRGVRGREVAMIFQEPMTSLREVLAAVPELPVAGQL